MKVPEWSPTNGPTVPTVSPQVRALGPHANSGTKMTLSDHHPRRGWSGGSVPLQITEGNTNQNDSQKSEPIPEPTDEDIWLAGIAARVEADARPLFAALWVWLLRQALEVDDTEPAA